MPAAASPETEHIHTFVKFKGKFFGRTDNWTCASPDCNTIRPPEQVIGKLSRCTLCGIPFTLTREDMRRARPRCLECSDTKKGRILRKTREALTRFDSERSAE